MQVQVTTLVTFLSL